MYLKEGESFPEQFQERTPSFSEIISSQYPVKHKTHCFESQEICNWKAERLLRESKRVVQSTCNQI